MNDFDRVSSLIKESEEFQNLDKLQQLKEQITNLEKSLLQKEYEEKLAEIDPSNIEERFWLFSESRYDSLREHFNWIQHVYSSDKRDLFEYEEFLYWERREIITLEKLGESFSDYLSYECKQKEYPQKRIHDWMEGLMSMNFGSCVMDW